jgi:hypothetical protein
MNTKHTTREAWLVAAVEALGETVFAPANITLPAVRVSVGWPGGRGSKNNVIGQCWSTGAAKDKVANLFISPVLDDAARVLDVLAHELVHAVDDCQNGHKGPFATMAKAIGLTGKMTATVASDDLKATLSALVTDRLGDYPHAAMVAAMGTGSTPKQTTRMLKVECPETGYVARTTAKWLDAYGAPKCPCCDEEMQRA